MPENWDITKLSSIIEEGTRKAPVPKGYIASSVSGESKISDGLVIYQGTEAVTSSNHETALTTRNQFVWIPVDDINQMVMCKSNTSTSVCNLVLQTDGTLKCMTHNSTDLCGRLYGTGSTSTTVDGKTICSTSMDFKKRNQTWTSTGYREPDIVSDYDKDDATSGNNYMELAGITDKKVATFSAQLTNDFKAMAESVAKYGGFYIARYEAGENGASLKNQVVITASTGNGTIYKGVNKWYGLYGTLRSSTAVDKTAVSTHMVWGSMYDMVIKFLEEDSANGPQVAHVDRQLTTQRLTGANSADVMSNIYDLEGNNREWTAQVYNAGNRVSRGSNCSVASGDYINPASLRFDYIPYNTSSYYSSRGVLYL